MLIIAGFILAFVLILVFSNRATRNCRWRAERSGDCEGRRKYRCATCGAEAFTETGQPPRVCLADRVR